MVYPARIFSRTRTRTLWLLLAPLLFAILSLPALAADPTRTPTSMLKATPTHTPFFSRSTNTPTPDSGKATRTNTPLIRPTNTEVPIIGKATPTPTEKFIILPTLPIIPTIPLFPTLFIPTPTPIPFDLAVSKAVMDTTAVIQSIAGMNNIAGSFTLAVNNAPVSAVPVILTYNLLDTNGKTIQQWRVNETIKFISSSRFSLESHKYKLSLLDTDVIPFDNLQMHINVAVDEKAASVLPDKESLLEKDLSNNTAVSPTKIIPQLSGKVYFGDILTYIKTLAISNYSPFIFSGSVSWNDVITVTCTNLEAYRNTVLDLEITSGSANFTPPSNPYNPEYSSWSYTYTNGIMDKDGARAELAVVVPEGTGYRKNVDVSVAYLDTPFPLGTQNLAQTLQPAEETITIPDPCNWISEGIPVIFHSDGQTFNEKDGFVLVHPSANYQYAPHYAVSPVGKEPSNDGFYLSGITITDKVAFLSSGLSANLTIKPGSFSASFPLMMNISFDSANVVIKSGAILPKESIISKYAVKSTENQNGCQASSATIQYNFDGDGMILEDGAILIDQPLRDPVTPKFNNYVFSPVDKAVWYQPGNIIPSSGAVVAGWDISKGLLGMRSRDGEYFYTYGDSEFEEGAELFSGINLMPEVFEGKTFICSFAKSSTENTDVEFECTEWTKTYIRYSGYSGVVDAKSQDTKLELYPDPQCSDQGYMINLTSFGQAYLSNQSDGLSSTTDGEINIPWPSAITLPFEDMTLDSCGVFTDGKIPADAQEEELTLAYWSAPFKPLTLAFTPRTDASPPTDQTLWITSQHTISHISDPVLMQLNIRPCGTMGDSKIEEPLATRYDQYQATISKIYLSAYDNNPNLPNGFYSVVGDMVVAFFTAPHFQSIIRSTSGQIATGDPWFNEMGPAPDANGDGFADTYSSAITPIENKISDYGKKNPITVSATFANLVELNYPIEYSSTTKQFKSTEPWEEDLAIVDMISSVKYLNEQKTEIDFGVDVGALPEISLSSLTSEFSNQIQETFLGPVRDSLDDAGEALTSDLSTLVRPEVENFLNPLIQKFVAKIQQKLGTLTALEYHNYLTGAEFQTEIDTLLTDINLEKYLRDQLSTAQPVINEIKDITNKLETAFDALHYDLSEIQPVVDSVLKTALDYIGVETDYNIADLMGPVDDVRQNIADFLDEYVKDPLDEVKDFSDNPQVYLNQYFPLNDILTLNTQIVDKIKSDLLAYADNNPNYLLTMQPSEITDVLCNALFNSEMFQNLALTVTNKFFPIKTALTDQAQSLLDEVNDTVTDFLEEQTDIVDGVAAQFKEVQMFKGGSLKGYAIFSGSVMDKIHIDGKFTMATPDEITYAAYLDMTRMNSNDAYANCMSSSDESTWMDVRIGATDIDLSWTGAELTADVIELKFIMSGGTIMNIGGKIEATGGFDFEAAKVTDPKFAVGIGAVENYIAGSVKAQINNYKLSGGIFLGSSCTMEPLEMIDPEVASLITATQMRGVFLSVSGSFPIYDYGCGFRVAAEGGVAIWYFIDGPVWGGKIEAGAYGEAACIVSVKGKLTLIGGKDSTGYFFNGNAWVAGGIGFCSPGSWDTPEEALDDSWCLVCVAMIDVTYKNGWSVDYDVECD